MSVEHRNTKSAPDQESENDWLIFTKFWRTYPNKQIGTRTLFEKFLESTRRLKHIN